MAMKPILFNTEMVRAILDGRKTVTRRVIRGTLPRWNFVELRNGKSSGFATFQFGVRRFPIRKSPYQPGDILWVRETWARGYIDSTDTELCNESWFEENYKEPTPDSFIDAITTYFYRADFSARDEYELGMKWRPSIHMPREAARIFLRVTDVRVERLQDITMTDMAAEGVIPKTVTGGQWQQWQEDYMRPAWDSTVKPKDRALYGWEVNPWVWVISFEQITQEEAET